VNWNVAITGMNARPENPGPGYPVARCLRQAHDFRGRLVGLGYDVLDAGLYHTHCDTSYLLPYPAAGPEALLERLIEIHEREHLDAVVPCLDAELPGFIAIADQLRQKGIHSWLPTATQLKARNKDRLPDLCRRLGVSTPETRTVSDPGFFRRSPGEGWDYPLVVKGAFYDAATCYTAEEAESAYFKLAAQWGYPVLVQRFLEGQEINLTGLGTGRALVGSVMMRKRAVTDKGKAWAGVSVVDEQLERLAATLVEGLGWCGPLEVEVLRTPSGQLNLIEINPRFPAWVYLSHGVGRNLPRALLDLMLGRELPDFPPLRPGLMFLRYAEEMIVDLKSFENLMMCGALVA
jgi:carbamoyl-phosphate synthase large subunit